MSEKHEQELVHVLSRIAAELATLNRNLARPNTVPYKTPGESKYFLEEVAEQLARLANRP